MQAQNCIIWLTKSVYVDIRMYACMACVTQINFGKFLENGSSGYILKPEYMRNIHVPKPAVSIAYINSDNYNIMYCSMLCEYMLFFLNVCMYVGKACALDFEYFIGKLSTKARRCSEGRGTVHIHTYILTHIHRYIDFHNVHTNSFALYVCTYARLNI